MEKYDVIVSGGGLSGVAAAVAAAREGLSVLVIERYGFLGGMATAGLVNPFMRYTLRDGSDKVLNAGIFGSILKGLDEMNGLHENRTTFNEVIMQLVLDELIQENKITLLLHTLVISCEAAQGHISSVTVSNKSGTYKLYADYFIDATGDGDISAMSGCKYEVGRKEDGFCQPMTLCFRIGGIDMERVPCLPEVNKVYNSFQKKGLIKNKRENILWFPHMLDGVIHFNTTRIIKKSPECARELTEAELEARAQMKELYLFLKENIAGFENSQLLMSAAQTGVRESRRIKGLYTITADDLLSCTKFEDSIARGNYDIDIHNPAGTGTYIRAIPPDEYYTIPYRALIPQSTDNLIVCGRPISSTHEAHSAYRVMPICCNIGEAAGIAAETAFKKKIKPANVDVKEIQHTLTQHGGLY